LSLVQEDSDGKGPTVSDAFQGINVEFRPRFGGWGQRCPQIKCNQTNYQINQLNVPKSYLNQTNPKPWI
jgi:hypothetical protein